MMDSGEYSSILRDIHLLIFAHHRQQGINTAREVYLNGGSCSKKNRHLIDY